MNQNLTFSGEAYEAKQEVDQQKTAQTESTSGESKIFSRLFNK